MKHSIRHMALFCLGTLICSAVSAQRAEWYTTTEAQPMTRSRITLKSKATTDPLIHIDTQAQGPVFRTWGTTFNEMDWAALQLLTPQEREQILHNLFAPDGDLRFTGGRIGMNANDYALSWYSCDEVDGDFQLHYFNIDRDRQHIIPFIHAAQQHQPALTFWASPWSPPSWMKINHHYAVQSNPKNDLSPQLDRLLFEDGDRSVNEQVNPDKNLFPRRLTVNDYLIQDPRYLQTYANYFCRFIDEYAKENIPITMVMYQNEAYSYTPYPGCPWTPEGAIRFNMEYLAPTLQRQHPEVALYMGTFNTNRHDNVSQILSDPRMPANVKGVGIQWEGRQILPRLRRQFPQWEYICSESECGWGSFDWGAAEHTFELINHYLGHGCTQYYNWNAILCDQGESVWGWKQNALIQVNSQTRTFRYAPEYYAYMHYSRYIPSGSTLLGFKPEGADRMPVLAARTPQGQTVVVAANFNGEARSATIQVGRKYIETTLPAHSFHTFVVAR